jgi:hypothetical protein
MAAVPVIINGVLMPKGKGAGDKPVPAVFIGALSIQGLEVGGGPVIPPDAPPVDPPIDPPPTDPGPGVAVVIKPAPVTGGWGIATDTSGQQFKWFFTPGAGGAGPKR